MREQLVKYCLISITALAIILISVYLSPKNDGLHDSAQQSDAHPKLTLNQADITVIKTLKTKDGVVLGDITVTNLHSAPADPSSGRKLDDVFSALYIVKMVDGKNIILYKINSQGFFNTLGKDMEFAQDDFYGYQFAHIYDDHFVVHGLANNGKSISDDVTVVWNSAKSIFEIQRIQD